MRLFIAIQFNDQMLEALTKLQGVGSFGDIFWAGIAENEGLELYARQIRRRLRSGEFHSTGKNSHRISH